MGLLLLAASLCLAGYNLYLSYHSDPETALELDVLKSEIAENTEAKKEKAEALTAAPEPSVTPSPEDTSGEPAIEAPKETHPDQMPENVVGNKHYVGVLSIEALELELAVQSEYSDNNAMYTPCRYRGTTYEDNLVICAHNYKKHFGQLEKLNIGDRISFTDVDGNTIDYSVVLKETLERTAIEEMTSGEYDLTLFTCTPGGAARVTIRCDRVEETK